jgi:hypothetical protein
MKRSGPKFAAFDQGQIPQIAVFNQAKTPLGLDLDALIAAMQKFVTDYVVPVWGTPARLVKTNDFKKGGIRVSTMPTRRTRSRITTSRPTASRYRKCS